MYGQSAGQVLGWHLPNTGDNWAMNAAAIISLAAGVIIIVSTVAFMVAKKAHKA
jgi:LPXTG cell wall anchor motif